MEMPNTQADLRDTSRAIAIRLLRRPAEIVVASIGERCGGRRLALLAYLQLGPESVTRDELCDLLWDPRSGVDARPRLRELLRATRQILPAGVLTTEGTVSLDRCAVSCDVTAFRNAIGQGRLHDAAELYKSDFMAGACPAGATEFAEWADETARALRGDYERVLRALVVQYRARTDYEAAARCAMKLWTLDPDDTDAALLLLDTVRESGDRSTVLETAARLEAHFRNMAPEVPEALASALRIGQAIEPDHRRVWRPAQLEHLSAGHGEHGGRDVRFPALLLRRGWYALPVVLLIALLVAHFSAQKTPGPTAPAFGGGGTLIMGSMQGSTRAIRFVGPRAQDTASAVVAAADSLLVWGVAYSPALRAGAYTCNGGGADLRRVCIHYLSSGRTVRWQPPASDVSPVGGWSPEGSWLGLTIGTGSGAHFHYDAAVVNIPSERIITLSSGLSFNSASWSPDGSRILIQSDDSRNGRVQIRTVDGRRLAKFDFPGEIITRWSPDGSRILVARHAPASLYLLSGNKVARVPIRLERIGNALWSPDGTVVALITRRSNRDVLVICQAVDCTHPALEIRDVNRFVWIPDRPLPYLAKLKIFAESTRVSAGGKLRIVVTTVDQYGKPYKAPYLTTIVEPAGAAWLDSSLTLHPVRPGPLRVLASAGGWQADTLEIDALPADSIPLLTEDWEKGLDTTQWKLWGSPLPSVVVRGGNRAFRNNGDDNFPSGATTYAMFDLSRGMTLEWLQHTPLTGDYWQEIWIDMSMRKANEFHAGLGDPIPARAIGNISVRTPIDVYQPPVPMLSSECRSNAAWSESPKYDRQFWNRKWHHVIYQLHPDGRCELAIDGRLLIAHPSSGAVNFDVPYALAIGGRTWNTDILLDNIQMWRGIRYAITRDGKMVPAWQ